MWFRKIRWKRMRLRFYSRVVGGSTFFECPCVNRVPQNAFELWCNTCLLLLMRCRPLSHIFMDGTMSENPRAKRDLWKSLIALCQDSKSSHFTIYLPRSTFAQRSDGTYILPHQTTHCIFFNFLEIKDLNPRLLWFRMCTSCS